MLIFANTCVESYLYKKMNLLYNHPLMSVTLNPLEYIDFIKTYENINFNNITFTLKKMPANWPWNKLYYVKAILDKNLNVNFVHHFYKNCDWVKSEHNNIFSRDILTYVKLNYFKRLSRFLLIKNTENPIFIFHIRKNFFKWYLISEKEFLKKLLALLTNKRIIIYADLYYLNLLKDTEFINLKNINFLLSNIDTSVESSVNPLFDFINKTYN